MRATFIADLTSFTKAVEQGKVTLKSFESSASTVEKQLNRIGDSFSGRRIIQEAHLSAKAVEEIGGASRLTESEQRRVNNTVSEALSKYKALGQDAPKHLIDIERATRGAGESAGFLSTKTIAIGSAIGSALGNVAANALMKVGQLMLDAAANAQKFSGISASFDRLTDSIGESGDAMLSVTRTATKGLVSDLDLMQSANKAMLLGLPVTSKEMGTLSKAAVTLGRAMGQDATKSLDDLITALGRSSPLILDNLGLTVKVGEANEKYAASLGKTANDLTDAEKKMAFYQAAMEAAGKKVDELGDVQLTVIDQLKRLGTSVGNVVTEMAAGANETGLFSKALGDMAEAATKAARNLRDAAQARKQLSEAGDLNFTISGEGLPVEDFEAIERAIAKIVESRSRALAQGAVGGLFSPDELKVIKPTTEEIRKLDEQTKKLSETLAKNAEWAKKNAEAYQLMLSAARNAQGMEDFNRLAADQTLRLKEVEDALRVAGVSIDEFDRSTQKGIEAGIQQSRVAAEQEANLRKLGMSLDFAAHRSNNASQQFEKATGMLSKFKTGLLDVLGLSGGFGNFLQGIGQGFLQGIGNMLSAGIAQLANLALKGLAGLGKKIWGAITGGPDEAELQGRESAAAFRKALEEGLSDAQRAEAISTGNAAWASTVIAIRDAYIALGKTEAEALAMADALWRAEKEGPEAVAAIIAQIQPIIEKHRDTMKEAEEAAAAAAEKAKGSFAGLTDEFEILEAKLVNTDAIRKIQNAFENFKKTGRLDLGSIINAVQVLQRSLGDNEAVRALQEAIRQAVETGIVDFGRLGSVFGDLAGMMAAGITIPIDWTSGGGGGGDDGGGDNEGGDRGGYLTPEEAREAGVQWRPKSDFDWSDSAYRDARDQDASEINKQNEEMGIARGEPMEGYAGGTGGRYLNFGSGTRVTLHGRERVMTEAEGAAEGANYAVLCAIQRAVEDLPRATAVKLKGALVEAGYRY